jgi:threonylcarbamoyladenosine tRNA methylthiotransferase MtaB
MAILTAAAAKSSAAFARSQFGKTLPVIFEQEQHGFLHGWSDNYLAVKSPAGSFPSGKIVHIEANEKNLAENLQNTSSDGTL